MQRRTFNRNLLLALLSAPLLGATARKSRSRPKKTLPVPRLKKGDTIGLITPGSFISDEGLEKAVKNVEELGFKVKLGKNIRKKRGFNAGTDAERLSDLHEMFGDPQVQGIWCARGGYGTTRLLPGLDFKFIRKHPKALIGYSDITALLNAIHSATGMVGFHGPVASSTMTDYTREHFMRVLTEEHRGYVIRPLETEEEKVSAPPHRPGHATGKLTGGNLTLLAALAGTPWQPEYRKALVFIEEIGEKPYRIDRMLTQIRQASRIAEAAGIALGAFNDCQPDEDELSLSLEETLADRLLPLGKPLAGGLSFGHIKNQCTLPIGVRATLQAEEGSITLEESGTAK